MRLSGIGKISTSLFSQGFVEDPSSPLDTLQPANIRDRWQHREQPQKSRDKTNYQRHQISLPSWTDKRTSFEDLASVIDHEHLERKRNLANGRHLLLLSPLYSFANRSTEAFKFFNACGHLSQVFTASSQLATDSVDLPCFS